MGIDKVLRKSIETGLIPGIVALVADDGRVVYHEAQPRRCADRLPSRSPNTAFERSDDAGRYPATIEISGLRKCAFFAHPALIHP